MKRIHVLYILLISTLSCLAQDNQYAFLNLNYSAHTAALGGRNVSLNTHNIADSQDNPALLSYDQSNMLSVNYMRYVSDINAGSILYGKSIGLRGIWAIGVTYINYGSFVETTPENIVLGSFSANDAACSGSYSYELTDRLKAGITGKFIYSGYERYTSWAIAVDLGLNYQNRENDFSAGLAIRNIGGQITSFGEQRTKMPWDISLGISQKLRHAPFRFSLTAQNLNNWNSKSYVEDNKNDTAGDLILKRDNFLLNLAKHFIIGAEFLPNDNFYIAAGFNANVQSDFAISGKKGIYGFSLGGGFAVKQFIFDASYFQRSHKGGTFIVGVTTNFDKFRF